jgi:hypothetical protein
MAQTTLSGTWAWNGTTTVTSTDTSQVVVGDFIALPGDFGMFEISSITTNVSVTILNPSSLTIPSGSGALLVTDPELQGLEFETNGDIDPDLLFEPVLHGLEFETTGAQNVPADDIPGPVLHGLELELETDTTIDTLIKDPPANEPLNVLVLAEPAEPMIATAIVVDSFMIEEFQVSG